MDIVPHYRWSSIQVLLFIQASVADHLFQLITRTIKDQMVYSEGWSLETGLMALSFH